MGRYFLDLLLSARQRDTCHCTYRVGRGKIVVDQSRGDVHDGAGLLHDCRWGWFTALVHVQRRKAVPLRVPRGRRCLWGGTSCCPALLPPAHQALGGQPSGRKGHKGHGRACYVVAGHHQAQQGQDTARDHYFCSAVDFGLLLLDPRQVRQPNTSRSGRPHRFRGWVGTPHTCMWRMRCGRSVGVRKIGVWFPE